MGWYTDRPSSPVEAFQFTDEAKDRVLQWAASKQMNVTHGWDTDHKPIIAIPVNMDSTIYCSLNDWLIHCEDHFIVMSDVDFQRKFEIVESSGA